MAFKTIASLDAETTIALGGANRKTGKVNPTSVEGYYLGRREVADKKKASGVSYIHFFQTSKGNLGVWGKTDIDRKLSSVTPGTMTRVTFDRMISTPNGEMYKFKVETDSDNVIEVAASEANDSYASDENDSDDTSAFASSEEDESNDDDLRATLASAAERKAKVEALLKRGNKTKN